jgi:RNA 2',3'-cyclic 3'-phosphodiesterase
MKLFFALWPDDAVRLQLATQRLEIARLTGGRPTLPVTLHMTLVFAGNVPESRLVEIKMAASRVKTKPFDYVIDTTGCFAGPKIAWLASDSTPNQLFELQSELQRNVAAADFEVDERTFRPHITIARDVTHIFEPHAVSPTVWHVNQFCLVQAIQTGNTIRYDILDRWVLNA